MKQQKTIAWQKYEDYIEKQLSSPMLTNIIQNIAALHNPSLLSEEDDEDEDIDDDEDYLDIDKDTTKNLTPFLPITNQIIEDVSMLATFDCWIGHTNFDITPTIKNILDTTEGVEVLKVLSRYRFFVGVGKLFDFKEVRQNIEEHLI